MTPADTEVLRLILQRLVYNAVDFTAASPRKITPDEAALGISAHLSEATSGIAALVASNTARMEARAMRQAAHDLVENWPDNDKEAMAKAICELSLPGDPTQ